MKHPLLSRKLLITLYGTIFDMVLLYLCTKYPKYADEFKWFAGFITTKVGVYNIAEAHVDAVRSKLPLTDTQTVQQINVDKGESE